MNNAELTVIIEEALRRESDLPESKRPKWPFEITPSNPKPQTPNP